MDQEHIHSSGVRMEVMYIIAICCISFLFGSWISSICKLCESSSVDLLEFLKKEKHESLSFSYAFLLCFFLLYIYKSQ